MLVKKELKCTFNSTEFPRTDMGRRINVLTFPDLNTEVYTVHLESVFRDRVQTKQEQFEYLMRMVSKSSVNAIVAGDMNLDKEDNVWVNPILLKYGITDVCPDIAKDEYTYDYQINTNVIKFSSRLDR